MLRIFKRLFGKNQEDKRRNTLQYNDDAATSSRVNSVHDYLSVFSIDSTSSFGGSDSGGSDSGGSDSGGCDSGGDC